MTKRTAGGRYTEIVKGEDTPPMWQRHRSEAAGEGAGGAGKPGR
ncbi:hypothetical protein HMPREF0262_01280 [Clostridium sp. ATCC 29733]|nr:hypothetical protein HMPREF0262_01280 [Clostridium sp. ATCC 29733]